MDSAKHQHHWSFSREITHVIVSHGHPTEFYTSAILISNSLFINITKYLENES